MAIVKTVHSDAKVKVAVVFELDKMRPVWFEVLGKERVTVKEITAMWFCNRGVAAKIINFEIWGGKNKYCLEYNTANLTWRVGETVFE